jgi:hypothetical protein
MEIMRGIDGREVGLQGSKFAEEVKMSVSISYRPLSVKEYLNGVTSTTVKTLEYAFGELPVVLNELEHAGVLQALAFAHGGKPNPYSDLALALVHNGSLRVEAEH